MSVKGLLLINLGSPDAPERREVKRYLDEFLMDPYVIDLPWALRWPLVRGLITPFRSGKSAKAYQSIWTSNGSPLTHFTREFAKAVKDELEPEWQVRWGMRYGEPSLISALKDWKVDELYVVPLYPQYAESSSRTAIDHAMKALGQTRLNPKKIFVLNSFYVENEFIKSQSLQISQTLHQASYDHLLLSFHGLPVHHLTHLHPEHCMQRPDCCQVTSERNQFCYRAQCFHTASAIAKQLGPEVKVQVSFQSRLGRRPWIKPYTDLVIANLLASGSKKILVSCPSFVADCLETLEEIEIRLREQFLELGGEKLTLVPALNAETHWVKGFTAMLKRPDLAWLQK